jgi:hypothetical protein
LDDAAYPALYRAANSASLKGQHNYTRLVRADLVCTIVAALLGAISSTLTSDASWWAAVALVCILVVAIGARTANRILRPERDWFDGRAVSESVKSATWKYVMRAEPYAGQDSLSVRAFVADLGEILSERRDLRQDLRDLEAGAEQVTDEMNRIRSLVWAERRAVYLKDRVTDQHGWYRTKATQNRRDAAIWFWVGLTAQLCAVVASAARLALPGSINFVGLFLSFAAVALAWSQLRRHDELGRSYELAAQELSGATTLLRNATGSEAEFVELVAQTEGAISREHKMWAAKRT